MLIISLYTAQNMIHLQLNFSLLILDKILMEAIASVASMIPYSPPLNEVFLHAIILMQYGFRTLI